MYLLFCYESSIKYKNEIIQIILFFPLIFKFHKCINTQTFQYLLRPKCCQKKKQAVVDFNLTFLSLKLYKNQIQSRKNCVKENKIKKKYI